MLCRMNINPAFLGAMHVKIAVDRTSQKSRGPLSDGNKLVSPSGDSEHSNSL
jgi:hypothetical protein